MAEAFTTGMRIGAVLDAAEAHLRDAKPAEIADLVLEGSATIPGSRRLAVITLPEHHRIDSYLDRSGAMTRIFAGLLVTRPTVELGDLPALALPALDRAIPGEEAIGRGEAAVDAGWRDRAGAPDRGPHQRRRRRAPLGRPRRERPFGSARDGGRLVDRVVREGPPRGRGSGREERPRRIRYGRVRGRSTGVEGL